MLQPLVLNFTDAGLAALQGATEANPIVIAQVGLSNAPFDFAPTLTALPGEFKRLAAISGVAAAANITHMTAYDTSADVWSATGVGLYLADGTLFAVYTATATILGKASLAFALISFDIAFEGDLSAHISFGNPLFTNPPATEDTRGLVKLATLAEAKDAIDALKALTPATAKAAVLGWLLGLDGAGSGLDADLLDGQHGAWYADIPARLGYTPLNVAVFTANNVLGMLRTVDGDGSGLDADLLGGFASGSYRRVVDSKLVENGGYDVFSDGVKECWGYIDMPANGGGSWNLPVAHTSWVNPVLGVSVGNGNTTQHDNTGVVGITLTDGKPTAIQLYCAEDFGVRVYIRTKGV